MTHKIVISKDTYNAITETDPSKLRFSSDFNTLKYYAAGSINLEIDAADLETSAYGAVNHNLGFYPYVEAYVDVWIGAPTGTYYYCPFGGAGATIFYSATFMLTDTQIKFYADIIGMSGSVWHFDFKYFIFRNDLDI